MNQFKYVIGLFMLPYLAQAAHCPDPETTSLKWGVPPAPWVVNPYSPNKPQGEDNTKFVRANILVAGYGQGVTCTYKISIGEYSIWWKVPVKIPARSDYSWIETLGGYMCTQGLLECLFYTAGG